MEGRSYPENYRNGAECKLTSTFSAAWSGRGKCACNPVLNLSDGRSGMVLDEVQSLL